MGHIRVMSAELANQIAAGEVVERPASCLKELIENSLDAGARHVRVKLIDGGITLIGVQDDGCGMDTDDAVLAFSRHATSKLYAERDLLKISTLGFRGEALASIAAVAKVRLETRVPTAVQGIAIGVCGADERAKPEPIGMPPGTNVEVRELFYNTPARLKYLRTVSTEQSRCVDVVQKAALARPDVAFTCSVAEHVLFQSSGRGRTTDVLTSLYGVGEASQFLFFEASSSDYRVRGWLGRPTQSKSSRTHGHFFVNGRSIRNLALHQAVISGYDGRLMVNRYPMYCVYIELDPTLVDVNIHPHKSEVRFSEERDLVQLIQAGVKQMLDDAFLVQGIRIAPIVREKLGMQTELPFQKSSVELAPRTENPTFSVRESHKPWQEKKRYASNEVAASLEVTLGKNESVGLTGGEATPLRSNISELRPIDWCLRPVGQALGMYLIADDGTHLYMIDQHAAHERVLYEKFMKSMKNHVVQSVPLLTPLPMSIAPSQYATFQERLPLLQKLGLSFENFGGYDVVLRSIPEVWEGLDYAKLVQDVVDSLSSLYSTPKIEETLRERIVMRACKAAIKANWHMSLMEMQALCEALANLDDPFHCPHGRPVFVRLSAQDLEKMFMRII